MEDFTLPANIKQIGSIGSGMRIYMEDYVYTFLQQYSSAGGFNERLAYLVGKHMVIDGQPFLFVSGAIYGMHTEQMEGYLRFSAASAEYAEAMLTEHFPGQEIVGWMQSQPSYGTYLNQNYAAYHMRQFTKPYHVLFVMDPLEKINTFYTANPNAITPMDRLTDLGGYFIYYEKNLNMHEYMLTNQATDQKPTFVDFTPVSPIHNIEVENFEEDDSDDPEEVIRKHRLNTAERRSQNRKKSGFNMVASLCAVLFVVTFVMGVSLVRNQDRIDRMEGEIRQLVTAHRNLFTQLSNPEFTPVFAEVNPQPTQPATQPATAPATQAAAEPVTEAPTAAPTQAVYIPTEAPTVAETMPPTEPPTQAYIPREPVPVQAEMYAPTEITPHHATYTIQPGDSLLAIALYFFGDANMMGEILALNGLDDPNHIVAGRTIALPFPRP